MLLSPRPYPAVDVSSSASMFQQTVYAKVTVSACRGCNSVYIDMLLLLVFAAPPGLFLTFLGLAFKSPMPNQDDERSVPIFG